MTGITAVKPVYNRRTKEYEVDVVYNADLLLAHQGWLVFEDAGYAHSSILGGILLQGWTPKKVNAVLAYLRGILGNKS